ncbi:uncharacterized protein LOC141857354 [Brevipalpus obovatus]|uniref:uncharacterized protein LOC141857354 n=1 Tax=Brevipalpus obovatus TaxID=246614 RepID=UPI003D9F2FE0
MSEGKESINYVSFTLTDVSASLPYKETIDSAGYILKSVSCILITRRSRLSVSFGVKFQIPRHLYGQIAPLTELALKGIDVAGCVISPDNEDEVRVLLVNHTDFDVWIQPSEAIAQVIFTRILNQKKMYALGESPANNSYNQGDSGSSGYQNAPASLNSFFNKKGSNQQQQHKYPSSKTQYSTDGAYSMEGNYHEY